MPKIKSHSSTKKRVSVTGTGKSSKRKMSLKQSSYVDSANKNSVKKLLPYA